MNLSKKITLIFLSTLTVNAFADSTCVDLQGLNYCVKDFVYSSGKTPQAYQIVGIEKKDDVHMASLVSVIAGSETRSKVSVKPLNDLALSKGCQTLGERTHCIGDAVRGRYSDFVVVGLLPGGIDERKRQNRVITKMTPDYLKVLPIADLESFYRNDENAYNFDLKETKDVSLDINSCNSVVERSFVGHARRVEIVRGKPGHLNRETGVAVDMVVELFTSNQQNTKEFKIYDGKMNVQITNGNLCVINGVELNRSSK